MMTHLPGDLKIELGRFLHVLKFQTVLEELKGRTSPVYTFLEHNIVDSSLEYQYAVMLPRFEVETYQWTIIHVEHLSTCAFCFDSIRLTKNQRFREM
jgi:hypothetical protein